MTYTECKNKILLEHRQHTDLWYAIIGRMYEATRGCSLCASCTFQMDETWWTLFFDNQTATWSLDKIIPSKQSHQISHLHKPSQRIKLIRKYHFLNMTNEYWYDIVYYSGMMTTRLIDTLPKTAHLFIQNATKKTLHYNQKFDRDELIYSME